MKIVFPNILNNLRIIGLLILTVLFLLFTLPEVANAQELILEFGQFGNGQGEFNVPSGIEVDSEGNILIADRMRNLILRFDSDGEFVDESASFFDLDVELNPPLSFDQVNDIAIANNGNIYAANEDDAEIVVLDPDFNPLFNFGGGCAGPDIPGEGCTDPDGDGPLEIGDGEFDEVGGIAFDPSGRIVALDNSLNSPGSNRVQVFDLDGNFLFKFGTGGAGNGQFQIPSGVDVDASGNIYVADTGNDRIQVFESDGTFVRAFGTDGTPTDVAVDLESNIYVAESGGGGRIQVFDSTGNLLQNIEVSDFPANGIDVDNFGYIYVTSSSAGGSQASSRVRVYSNISAVEIDNDGDGLLDLWEEKGIDVNFDGTVDLNLPALGADPLHKDIFVEVDYMTYHQPEPQAISDVIQAFADAPVDNPDGNSGITLHVEIDEEISHIDKIAVFCDDEDEDEECTDINEDETNDFDSIKKAKFGTLLQRSTVNAVQSKKLAYHYGLFIHNFDDKGTGGRAEGGGNDFVLSFGNWQANDEVIDNTGNPHNTGSVQSQTLGFMHELGHNLGLTHGGGEALDTNENGNIDSDESMNNNCKPNYLSIMNYSYVSLGIPEFLDEPTNPLDQLVGRLDYSRSQLPQLDEKALNEEEGISNGNDYTLWTPDNGNTFEAGLGNGPLDWNGNGSPTDLDDININNLAAISGCGSPIKGVLEGHNDWENLDYNFRNNSGFADGIHLNVVEQEYTFEIAQIFQEFWENLTDLEITKSASTEIDTAVAGQELVYTLTIQNNGPNQAQDVQVTDILPPEVTYISDTGNCIENPENQLTCDLGELPAGESIEFNITTRIPADLPCNGEQFTTIENNASVINLAGSDLDTTNNQVTEHTDVLCIKYEYSAKLICGKQKKSGDLRLARGSYATAINIHNPNDEKVYLFKKLALTYPPKEQKPGRVIPIAVDSLDYDEALAVDCIDLQKEAFDGKFPEPYVKGFVVIQSPRSLDVTAVYTSASLDWKGKASKQSGIDVEQIRERVRELPEEVELPDLVPLAP